MDSDLNWGPLQSSLRWQSNAQAETPKGCTPRDTHMSLFNKTCQHLSKRYKKKVISFQASIYLAPSACLERERIGELKPKRKQSKKEVSLDYPGDHSSCEGFTTVMGTHTGLDELQCPSFFLLYSKPESLVKTSSIHRQWPISKCICL